MGADGLAVLWFLFVDVWHLFTRTRIPGTQVSPASWAFFGLAVVAALRMIKTYFLGRDDK